MITIKSVSCNNCGANISIDPNNISNFCPYCGTQLFYDDGVLRTEIENNINLNINQRLYQYDEVKIKELEFQREMYEKSSEREAKQRKMWMCIFAFFATIFFAMGIAAAFLWKSYSIIAILMLIFIVVGIATLLAAYLTYFFYKYTKPEERWKTIDYGIASETVKITETPTDRVHTVWKIYRIFLLVVALISLYAICFAMYS